MSFNLGSAVVQIRGDVRRLAVDIAQANRMLTKGLIGGAAAAGITIGLKTAVDAAGSLARMMGNVGQAMFSVGKQAIAVNDEIEHMSLALGVVMKSQAGADALISQVRELAADTPFSAKGLMRDVQLLKNYGIETKKLIPMLKTIGDAAAASPTGMEHATHRIALAIGQMKSHGKLLGGELKQLAEVGVAAQEILTKAFGMPISEIQKANKAGLISIDQIIDALLNGMSQKFGGTMDKIARTWSGATERIKDRAQIAFQQITQPLFEIMRSGRVNLADMLDTQGFKNAVASVRSAMQSLADAIRMMQKLLAPTGKILVDAFKQIAPLIAEIVRNMKGMGDSQLAWAVIAKYVRDFNVQLKASLKTLKEWIEFGATLSANLKLSFELLGLIMQKVALMMIAHFNHVWESLKVGAQNAAQLVSNVFLAVVEEIKTAFATLTTFLAGSLLDLFSTLKQIESLKGSQVGQIPGLLKNFAAGQAGRNAALAGSLGKQAAGAAGRIAGAAGNGMQPMPGLNLNTSGIDARINQIIKMLMQDRKDKNNAARLAGIMDQIRGAAGAAPGQLGGLAGAFGNMFGNAVGGAGQGIARLFAGGESKKPAKAEFVGLSELSKNIQLGLINSDEKKDRKAMVKGVNAIDMGVQGVKAAVDAVKGAIQNWVPKAI